MKWVKIKTCLKCQRKTTVFTKPPDGSDDMAEILWEEASQPEGFNINGFCKSPQCGNKMQIVKYRIIPGWRVTGL